MGFSYEYAWPFVKCTYRTYSMLWKILPLELYTSPLSIQPLQSGSFLSDVSYATTVISLTTTKSKPLILLMPGFALSYTAKIFILMILYDLVLPAKFSYVIVYHGKLKALWKSQTGVQLEKFPILRRTLFCRRCNFKSWVSAANTQVGQV
jgi:hypothetical protein